MAHRHLSTTLIGGVAGAVMGALSSLVVTFLATRWRICKLHRGLLFEPQPGSTAHSHKSARIYNSYIFPLNSVFAYISINHQMSDIVAPPPGKNAFVNTGCPLIVNEDRLCWSFAGNPASIDIYAGEKQAIGIANVTADWIEFPSENGWATMTSGKTSRVFLKRKKYHATIKIVSKDTKAKEFKIVIDPDNVDLPIILLRSTLLERFRQWCRPSQ